jgi:DNA-binding LacI/PurR family transcriptional regulator
MPVNIYDIANKAGVSVVTVSRVLNNHPKVRENNRRKVLAAIEELDYKPNAAARSLARGKTGMIGLVLPGFGDAFITQVMSSVERILAEKGLFMVVSAASCGGGPMEDGCIRLFREGRVDGMLILAPLSSNEYIIEMKKRDMPFVLLDQHQSNVQAPSVTIDNFYGGYQAALCLIRGGAKRIAHIRGPAVFESSRQRAQGFLKALSDSGVGFDAGLLAEGDFTVACGYNAAKGWIRSGTLPDAVFAADDNTAFGVLDAAREFNIDVPGRLSVIGYDDHPFTSMLHPGVSTVRQPADKMAGCGVELLLGIMSGKVKRLTKVTLKPTVIVRGTTR